MSGTPRLIEFKHQNFIQRNLPDDLMLDIIFNHLRRDAAAPIDLVDHQHDLVGRIIERVRDLKEQTRILDGRYVGRCDQHDPIGQIEAPSASCR